MQNLVDPAISYRHRAISEKIQWNAQGLAFMLNADVALFIDIQVVDFFLEMLLDIFMMSRLLALWDVSQWQVDEDGRSSCDFSTCDPAPTATAVQAFAASNEVISLLCF